MAKHILVLDDSHVVLDVARQYLEDAGYAVSTADSLVEFDQKRLANPPDLILLDIQMPEVSGDDLGVMLRGERGVKVPIVLFSTLPEDELARRTTECQLDGYVSKNAGLKLLVERVRSLIG